MFLAAALLVPAGRAVADSTFGGVVYSRLNLDLQQDDPWEDHLEWRNKLFVRLQSDVGDDTQAVFSTLLEHNTLTSQETVADYRLGLWEGYVRFRWDDFELFAGKQIADWGMSDASVVDVLNPRDLTEFVKVEEEFAKLPVLMLRGVYITGDEQFELAYVPFYVPSELSLYGSDWSLVKRGALADIQEGDLDADAFARQGIQPGYEEYPPYNAVNGMVAARWLHLGYDFDYQITVMNGWELLPLFKFEPDFLTYVNSQEGSARETLESLQPQEIAAYAPLYRSRPIRQTQVGGGFAGILGDSTVRGEVSVVHPQELYTSRFELTEHTIAMGTFGIDRFLPGNIYANVNYLGAWVGQYPDEGLYLIDRYNHFLLGVLRGSYLGETLAPEIRAIVSLSDFGWFVNPKIPYKLTDNLQMTLGAYIIKGGEDTIFGQFQDNSYTYLQAKYSF